MLQDKVIKVWELHWFHSFVQIYWTIWLTQIFRAPGRKHMGLSLSIPYFFYKLKFFFCHAIKYKIFNHAQFTIRLSLKFAWSQYKITNCKKTNSLPNSTHIQVLIIIHSHTNWMHNSIKMYYRLSYYSCKERIFN